MIERIFDTSKGYIWREVTENKVNLPFNSDIVDTALKYCFEQFIKSRGLCVKVKLICRVFFWEGKESFV